MPTPGPPVDQGQGARSREEIMDAAERLMGAHGYAATSISALAKASGLPPSSIYWHFGSKSGLLGAVMQRGAQRFFTAANPSRPEEDRRGPRERLACLVAKTVASMRDHSQFVRLFFFLLLGGDGEHSQYEAVLRVHADANRLLGRGLSWVYQPWGEQVALRVADELADTAQALFDGFFVAMEAGARSDELAEHVEAALHALAERVRARG